MKHYDKIFLLVAVLILGASAAFYMIKSPEIAARGADTSAKLALEHGGEKWQNKDVTIKTEESKEWPEVKAQDEDRLWYYQVFTPPKIWIDKKGEFIAEPPYKVDITKKSFALRFGEVSNRPYHIVYKGVIGSEKDPIVQFEDTDTNVGFHGKLNEEIKIPEPSTGKPIDSGLILRSFKRERKQLDSKSTNITEFVTIGLEDKKLGRVVELYSDRPTIIEDQRMMILNSVNDPNFKWDLKEVGDSVKIDGCTYVLKKIDYDTQSATVEQLDDKGKHVQTVNVSASGNTEVAE